MMKEKKANATVCMVDVSASEFGLNASWTT